MSIPCPTAYDYESTFVHKSILQTVVSLSYFIFMCNVYAKPAFLVPYFPLWVCSPLVAVQTDFAPSKSTVRYFQTIG